MAQENDTRMLMIARIVVRVFLVANLLCAAAFLAAIPLSMLFEPKLAAHLAVKYGAQVDAAAVLRVVRLMLVLGIAAAGALHVIFAALLAMLATVRRGDPFTLGNAARLRRIGWALLAMQLLDLCLGGLTGWLSALHVRAATWSPDIGGWIAVLMAFVLAGVFARGAAMRDDLAMTI